MNLCQIKEGARLPGPSLATETWQRRALDHGGERAPSRKRQELPKVIQEDADPQGVLLLLNTKNQKLLEIPTPQRPGRGGLARRQPVLQKIIQRSPAAGERRQEGTPA